MSEKLIASEINKHLSFLVAIVTHLVIVDCSQSVETNHFLAEENNFYHLLIFH